MYSRSAKAVRNNILIRIKKGSECISVVRKPVGTGSHTVIGFVFINHQLVDSLRNA